MGYNFRIEYKTDASNHVADALSRRTDDTTEAATETANFFAAFAHPTPDIIGALKAETRTAPDLIALQAALEEGSAASDISFVDGLFLKGRRIYVSSDSSMKLALLYEHHNTPLAGHPGVDRTFRRLIAHFF